MKLNKVLHPETVLGLRGPEHPMMVYQALHKHLFFDPEKGYRWNANVSLRNHEHWTASHEEDMLITWKFRHERPPIYHAPKTFVQAIGKLDREIPVDLLPQKFFAYFSFPENSVWDGSEWVQGIYVFIGPANETALRKEHWEGEDRVFWAVYYTQISKENPTGNCARVVASLKETKKFTEIFKELPKDPQGLCPGPNVFLLGINLALYVNSIGCDLVEARPVSKMKPAEKKERQLRGEVMNQCLLPVTLVSWNYQHPRIYTKEKVWVDTFMRWQRCGPGLSQVKLIWVTAHERKFKDTMFKHKPSKEWYEAIDKIDDQGHPVGGGQNVD